MNEIKITLSKDNLHIKIDCEDRQYYLDLKEAFNFPVAGYNFMPRYLNSGWDGKVSLFNSGNKTLPYGIFLDYLKFHRNKYKNIELNVDAKVKALFNGKHLKPKFDLKFYPYDYQEDCILTILKHTKCIVKVATASGKSLIISYVIKTLLEKYKNKQYLIIVPTTNLVEQFYKDMIDYGIDSEIIGRVYSDIKEPDKTIVVSTWQSLMNNHDWLDRFYGVVVDECHITSSGQEVKKILTKACNAVYRFGVTGTLPSTQLELSNVKAFLGPVVKNYSAKELGDAGSVSQCRIIAYNLQHQQEFDGEYFEVREKVFQSPARLSFIKDTINDIGMENILVLVNLVEKEGMVLRDYLKKHMPDREVIFLWGDTKVKEREFHRKDFDDKKNKVVISTWPLFKLGVNVPSLKYIMMASPLKSKISVLQSVGRVLRKHFSKVDGAVVIDIIDQVPYLYSHGEIRGKYYKNEGFKTTEKKVCLPDGAYVV